MPHPSFLSLFVDRSSKAPRECNKKIYLHTNCPTFILLTFKAFEDPSRPHPFERLLFVVVLVEFFIMLLPFFNDVCLEPDGKQAGGNQARAETDCPVSLADISKLRFC